jgi:hypothetical protein
MAVSRVKTSSVLQGFPKSRSLLAGNTAYDPAATWFIQRVAGTGSSTTITFSSIPQIYKHLQIRYLAKDTGGTTIATLRITCNGVGGTSYAYHQLYGDGAAVTAAGVSSAAFATAGTVRSTTTANVFGVGIIDIHDYTSTTKNKTIRTFSGVDSNSATTSDRVYLSSGLFNNTSAITSLELITTGTAFTTTTSFALYGMVG